MKKVGWGQRLKEARERLGKRNLIAFSAQVGSNRTSWPKFEAEEVAPPLDVLIRVKYLAKISLDWLATGEEPPRGPVNQDVLRQVIQTVEEETPDIDAASKSRLIVRLYNDRIKAHSVGIEAPSGRKGKEASSL